MDLRPAALTGLSLFHVKHGVPVTPSNEDRLEAFRAASRERLPPGNSYPWPYKRKQP